MDVLPCVWGGRGSQRSATPALQPGTSVTSVTAAAAAAAASFRRCDRRYAGPSAPMMGRQLPPTAACWPSAPLVDRRARGVPCPVVIRPLPAEREPSGRPREKGGSPPAVPCDPSRARVAGRGGGGAAAESEATFQRYGGLRVQRQPGLMRPGAVLHPRFRAIVYKKNVDERVDESRW